MYILKYYKKSWNKYILKVEKFNTYEELVDRYDFLLNQCYVLHSTMGWRFAND